MTKFAEKLVGKKIVVIGGTSGLVYHRSERINDVLCTKTIARIGYGAAEAFLDQGAHVVVISSSADRVAQAVEKLKLIGPTVEGIAGDVRDEAAFVELLQKLAPVDHIVFTGVDIIIRGKLEDLNLDDAKHLFGVKFWGAVVVGKGNMI